MSNTTPSTYTVDFALRMLAQAIDFAEAEGDFTRARHCLKELKNSIEAGMLLPVPLMPCENVTLQKEAKDLRVTTPRAESAR